MFDLEKEILNWRRRMQAGGIKSPVPLDELESHLRDDVERSIKNGMSAQQAFKAAAGRIGQAGTLRSEFQKNGNDLRKKIGTFAVLVGAVVILRILLKYREMGYVWKTEQLMWLLFGIAAVAAGFVIPIFRFSLGETRGIRLWRVVSIVYSAFALWISMMFISHWLTEPRLSAAFGFSDRVLVFVAMAVAVLCIPGWRYAQRFLPAIRDGRTRMAIGVSSCLLGAVTMVCIWVFIFPHLGQMRAQVFTVLITWAWTGMAILGGVGYGLAQAARRAERKASA